MGLSTAIQERREKKREQELEKTRQETRQEVVEFYRKLAEKKGEAPPPANGGNSGEPRLVVTI